MYGVERKLWSNEVIHLELKGSIKLWDCTKCKEDGTNGGDCENCCNCTEGSEFKSIE